jgi:hypothetical protein
MSYLFQFAVAETMDRAETVAVQQGRLRRFDNRLGLSPLWVISRLPLALLAR